jgi:ABC-2 type transport system permease protein
MIRRTLAVIKKELFEIKRDKGFLLLLILQPIIIMSIFSFTFQGEIDNLPTAVVNYDNSEFAGNVISAIENSQYFNIEHLGSTFEDQKTTMEMLKK